MTTNDDKIYMYSVNVNKRALDNIVMVLERMDLKYPTWDCDWKYQKVQYDENLKVLHDVYLIRATTASKDIADRLKDFCESIIDVISKVEKEEQQERLERSWWYQFRKFFRSWLRPQ